MTTPIINLDDRRFDDLVEEAGARLLRNLPELTQIVPGDPVHALVDLFAWMTESIIYRANLIPERQRQAFLNLLQLPRRPASGAEGLVCIDSLLRGGERLLPPETALWAGKVRFTTEGDVHPFPLALSAVVKQRMSEAELAELEITSTLLTNAYPVTGRPDPFRPVTWTPGSAALDLGATVDNAVHLCVSVHEQSRQSVSSVKSMLLGRTLNVGIAPWEADAGTFARFAPARRLVWEIAFRNEAGQFEFLPLEVVGDGSRGARQAGVVRLRLPSDPALLEPHLPADLAHAGLGVSPPLHPASVKPEKLLFWLRLRCLEEPALHLGYLAVNAVEVIGRGTARDIVLGIGTGRPNQFVRLPHRDIEAEKLEIDVEGYGKYERWKRVEHFSPAGTVPRAFVLDANEGTIEFGIDDRPAAGKRIRAAYYRYGGGESGNLPPGSIKIVESQTPGLLVRHEWPTAGGRDAETVPEAEQRIPAFLAHRDRAVTALDFELIARDNPINPVARAHSLPKFFPGASLAAARSDVPGVVSIFVMPPVAPRLGGGPRPSKGLLGDVYDYLSQRTLLGTELYVLSPEFVPIAVSLRFSEIDPRQREQTRLDIERALVDYAWSLAPGGAEGSGWPFGRSVDADELRTVASRVPGVRAVGALHLFRRDPTTRAWSRVAAGSVALEQYQLPELLALEAQPGSPSDPPDPPSITLPPSDPVGGSEPVAIPVIPDLC